MRNPSELPAELYGRVFTRARARSLGVQDSRLRARDVVRVGHGTYQHHPLGQPAPTVRGPDRPGPDAWELLRALTMRTPNLWVSHVTAAQAYGLSLPRRVVQDPGIHLTAVNHCIDAEADPRVVLHRVRELPRAFHHRRGIRLSPPGRVFVELSRYLSPVEQVCLGDQMVRTPRREWEGSGDPLITLPDLQKAVEIQRRRPGIVQARGAVEMVRVGADSVPETRLRLALLSGGLPEPELQIRLNPNDPDSPVGDQGYRKQRIVLQYDGEHHFTPEQQQRDQWRNAQFESAGWTVVIVNRVDLRRSFRGVVVRVRNLLEHASQG